MRRKKLEIEAYTYDKSVFANFKWTSKSRKPSWWKNLVTMYTVYNSKSGIMVPTPTVKACPWHYPIHAKSYCNEVVV